MKSARIVIFFVSVAAGAVIIGAAFRHTANGAAGAPKSQQSQQAPPTVASAVDREISAVEKQVTDAAEAMPEAKFNFSPESLHLPGSAYKGVRSFAAQVNHI